MKFIKSSSYFLITIATIFILAGCEFNGGNSPKKIQQTICFSWVIGDKSKLEAGQCEGKTVSEMNSQGWQLTNIVTGLTGNNFGFIFTKVEE